MYHKTTLRNGVRILTERMPHFRSVSTGVWVSTGSRDESHDNRGITHFIEHMLFKGTRRRTAQDIARELDAVGGFSNAFTSKEQVCFHAKVLDAHLPLVVDVLTDIFLNSVFDPEEIEREKQVILQEIRMIEDTPDDYVHVIFQEMFWKDNPLGLPIYGSVESVEGIHREKILRYLASSFQPERVIVSAAGRIDHNRFVDLVGPTMEALSFPPSSPRRQTPIDSPMVRVITKDLEQVHICIGMKGTSQVEDARFLSHVLNVILGSSMSSRLFQEIREKRGLAYSIYSFVSSHEDTGLTGIYAGVAPENVQEAMKVIHEQLSILASTLIPEDELQAAKEYLRGSMYLNAESTDSRMNRLAKNEFLFGRYVPFTEIEDRMSRITSEQVLSWFRGIYQPDRLAALVYGPVDAEQVESEALGLRD